VVRQNASPWRCWSAHNHARGEGSDGAVAAGVAHSSACRRRRQGKQRSQRLGRPRGE